MVKYSAKKTTNRRKRTVVNGVVHVYATFNNTIISISDMQGDVLAWSSAGKMGFKGSRKATPYAAQVTTKDAVDKVADYNMQTAIVYVMGPGVGRDASLRSLQVSDLNITLIKDKTYHPHNGCRPPKRRRV